MRAIPGLLMLLAVSSASASATAAKFNLGSVFESVLTSLISDPEKVREDEHARQQQEILDEMNESARQKQLEQDELNRQEEVREDEHVRQQQKILDEMNESARQDELEREEQKRQEELRWEKLEEYGNTCNSIDKCNTYPGNRRVISGDLENVPYICKLDDSEGAQRRVDLEYKVNYENFVYASKQWLNAEKQCHQRLEAQREEYSREIGRKRDLELQRAHEFDRKMLRRSAERAKLPEPKIGMTKDQVKKSRWGSPLLIELHTDTQGKYEKWHYNNIKSLYFKNGRLTKITNIKSGS